MIHYHKIQPYIPYFFLAFFLLLIFPDYFYQLPEEGLDNSWNIALHLAHRDHFVHGKDLVFTYGPLGILNSRYPISVNLFVYLLFDMYFLVVMFFVLRRILKKNFNYGIVIFIFLSIITAMYEGIYQWYFFCFLFFLFSFFKKSNFGFLLHAAFLSILCFYFKVSFGIVAVTIFLMTMIYAVIRKKLSPQFFGLILGVYILTIFLTARFLLVDLKGYFFGSLHLINDYNDSMFRSLSDEFLIFGYAAVFVILIVVFYILYLFIVSLRNRSFISDIDQFFIYGIIALAVYIAFKGGFVRGDTHVGVFFKGMCLIMPLFYLFSSKRKQKILAALCCWIVLVISLWAMNSIPGSYKPFSRVTKLSFVPIKIEEIKHYFKGLMSYNSALENSKQLSSKPNDLKRIIGNHSVDVIPSEISKIYFNGLRYNPRPVIQSYSAYGRYLDSLNYKKYISQDAPEYILFSLTSIDDRFAFFDESKTKLAILKYYAITGEYGGDLILKRREAPRELIQEKEKEIVHAKMGEDIPVNSSAGLQYCKVFVDYTFLGKLKRLFYIPPVLKIAITLDNDEVKTFRAIKPILADGVVINKFIGDELEFKILMLSDGLLNTPIKKIRFESDSFPSGFVNNIKIVNTYYRLSRKPGAEKIADSLSVVETLNRYKPTPINSAILQKTRFRYGIDKLNTYGPIMRIEGWAFLDQVDNNKLVVKAILRSDSGTYELPTEKIFRPDLPAVFQKNDLANSGFLSTVSKSQLPPGNYQLGIVIYDTLDGKKWACPTGQYTYINTIYNVEKIGAIDPAIINKHNIRAYFDKVKESNNRVLVEGWSVVDNEDSKSSSTLLILQSKEGTYKINTDKRKRTDVSAHNKNPLLEYVGFSVEIPKVKLPEGVYTVGIEKLYGNEQRSLIFTDQVIKVGLPEIFTPVPLATLPPTKEFSVGIDLVKEDKSFVTISGWAVQKMDNVNSSIIEIVLKSNGKVYVSDTESAFRPDVTKHFNTKFNLDHCGFHAKIAKSVLPNGKYQIGIRIRQKDNNGTVKFIDHFVMKE